MNDFFAFRLKMAMYAYLKIVDNTNQKLKENNILSQPSESTCSTLSKTKKMKWHQYHPAKK